MKQNLPTIVVKDKVETKSESYQSGITKIGKSQQAAKDIPQSLIPIIILNDAIEFFRSQLCAPIHIGLRSLAFKFKA